MSILTTKSQINIASAQDLHNKNYYCSSIHCSYYSCIQNIMHIILFNVGIDNEKLKSDFRDFKKKNPENPGGLHEYYINVTVTYLKSKKLDVISFNKEIFKLKKTRTEADYLNIEMGYDDSRYSIQKADTINKILQKAF
ncbi:hypothetical protein [Mucilaginibacter sp.]|uniref:hypothetical protein n=1 Tax=Mucilaginibacter sp. TaxID=1882438 RepID=UPI0031B62141